MTSTDYHDAIVPVILSGGSGTRLWPMSTAAQPKQFLPLAGPNSLYLDTLLRVPGDAGFALPMTVCGPGHVDHVRADLARAGLAGGSIVVEPAARNTAPAIALAALAAGADATPILVMPSDQVMTNPSAFRAAVQRALPHVRQGRLATFGIRPTGPETGYGYIAEGEALGDGVAGVARFVEKPSRDRAEAMIAAGGHVWNAGIFLMRADAYLAALDRHAPAMAAACRDAWDKRSASAADHHPDAAAFAACPADSIDYAVMEKADDVVVVPVDPGWSDVGSWAALFDLGASADGGSLVAGDAIAIDTARCLIRGEGVRVSVLGVSDLIVVATATETLVIPRDRSQEVKRIVETIAARGEQAA